MNWGKVICRLRQSWTHLRFFQIFLATTKKTICENHAEIISCPAGQVIRIQSGYYGRTSKTVCPHEATHNTNCRAHGSYMKILGSCNNKPSCRLEASNTVYGDPCFGTYKYLDVQYTCIETACPEMDVDYRGYDIGPKSNIASWKLCR